MENLQALIPSLGVALLFFFIVRAFIRADRFERDAVRRLEEEEKASGDTSPSDSNQP